MINLIKFVIVNTNVTAELKLLSSRTCSSQEKSSPKRSYRGKWCNGISNVNAAKTTFVVDFLVACMMITFNKLIQGDVQLVVDAFSSFLTMWRKEGY